MDEHSPAESQNGPRPSLILKLNGPHPPSNRACRPCQIQKTRCEFDKQNPSAPCKRCTRKKLKCVMAMPTHKRLKLSHSTYATKASRKSPKPSATSGNPQNVANPGSRLLADSDAQDQTRQKDLQLDESERSLPAETPEQQAEATRSVVHAHTPPQDTSTEISTKLNSTPHSSNGHPPGMMLFPISQIEKVLNLYDRRKRQIQHLEAQVDDLEQSLSHHTTAAHRARCGALDQQRSLVAALGGALVRQANITDLNELYNLLEDLGVDQSYYWALSENEEFQAAFATPLHGHSRSGIAEEQGEESALHRTLKALHSNPFDIPRSPPSQQTDLELSRPTETPEKHVSMLATRTDTGPAVIDLIKAVASSKASAGEAEAVPSSHRRSE